MSFINNCLDVIFRGNFVGSKALDAYMRLIGGHFLHTTLSAFVTKLYEFGKSCEVYSCIHVHPIHILTPLSVGPKGFETGERCEQKYQASTADYTGCAEGNL